jgi:hypothetical protein
MQRQMATDLEIQKWVEERHGFVPHPGWIEHCRELCGLPAETLYTASPCPPDKQVAIKQAFRHFGMLPQSTHCL